MYLYLDVCTSSTVQHRPTVRPVLGCVVLTVVVRIQEGLRREAKWSWDGGSLVATWVATIRQCKKLPQNLKRDDAQSQPKSLSRKNASCWLLLQQ